jgi:uncharacterized membrane protein
MAAGYSADVLSFLLSGFIAAFGIFGNAALTSFNEPHALIFAAGVIHSAANLSFLLFSKSMPADASAVAPLSSLYVVLPVAVGMLALGEAVTVLKILGTVTAIAAIYLLGKASQGPHGTNLVKPTVPCEVIEFQDTVVYVLDSGSSSMPTGPAAVPLCHHG